MGKDLARRDPFDVFAPFVHFNRRWNDALRGIYGDEPSNKMIVPAMDVVETQEAIKKEVGHTSARFAAIGTAGENLVEVKVDIIKSSGPNPFQNPGEVYRVSFNTLELTPEYHSETLAPAANVRDVVIGEMARFWVREDGVYKEALVKAAPLMLKVFQDTDLLPAEITESVLRSKAGRFRITEGGRQRRPVRAPQVFAPEIKTGRPVGGATIRAREKKELLRGTASFQEVRGVGLVPVQAKPRTPAAAAAAEGEEAAQRAATARTGSPGRSVMWTGPDVGLYTSWVNVSQGIGHYAP